MKLADLKILAQLAVTLPMEVILPPLDDTVVPPLGDPRLTTASYFLPQPGWNYHVEDFVSDRPPAHDVTTLSHRFIWICNAPLALPRRAIRGFSTNGQLRTVAPAVMVPRPGVGEVWLEIEFDLLHGGCSTHYRAVGPSGISDFPKLDPPTPPVGDLLGRFDALFPPSVNLDVLIARAPALLDLSTGGPTF